MMNPIMENTDNKVKKISSDLSLLLYAALQQQKTVRVEITKSRADRVYFKEWDCYVYATDIHVERTDEEDCDFAYYLS